MPLNKAIEMLKDDYCDYVMYLKAKETANVQFKAVEKLKNTSTPQNELVAKNLELMRNLVKIFDRKTEEDLAMKELRVKDLEFLIIYLNRLKSNALRLPDLNEYVEGDYDEEKGNFFVISFQVIR